MKRLYFGGALLFALILEKLKFLKKLIFLKKNDFLRYCASYSKSWPLSN